MDFGIYVIIYMVVALIITCTTDIQPVASLLWGLFPILYVISKLKEIKFNSDFSKKSPQNMPDVSESNSTDLETIENKIIECLNEADTKLDADDFSRLAESIIDYIDEIGKSKKL